MYRTKRRNHKHHFFSRTIVVRNARSRLFPVGFVLCLLAMALASFFHLPNTLMEYADTNFLLSCFQASAPYLCGTHLDISVNPAYQMIDLSLPMIRSNQSMAKKYSALFDTSIRLERQAPIKKEETKIGNIPVQTIDLSSKKGITFSNATSYAVNADELTKTPLLFSSSRELPRVLIVHTHASEAYAESEGGRSKNEAENVIRIGKEIADTLNQNGIITIHDKTKNDEPDYNGSYKKALSVIQKNLDRYPSIEIVLDVHRDYIVRDSGKPSEIALKPTLTERGKNTAQIMFVVGTDALGLTHPDWKHNLAFAVQLQTVANRLHPGLCRPINLRTERFNQHMTKGSLIVEVGASANTLNEAVSAGKYVGEALVSMLGS